MRSFPVDFWTPNSLSPSVYEDERRRRSRGVRTRLPRRVRRATGQLLLFAKKNDRKGRKGFYSGTRRDLGWYTGTRPRFFCVHNPQGERMTLTETRQAKPEISKTDSAKRTSTLVRNVPEPPLETRGRTGEREDL